MDNQKLDMFIMANKKYFPEEKMMFIREKLMALDENKFALVSTLEFKDPTTLILVSLFLVFWGIDRFMLGETGMGILKLLTVGCCGVLMVVDWFSISKKTKECNFRKLMSYL